MEVIVSSIISAVAAIVVGVFTSNAQHRRTLAEIDKQNALQQQRIEILTNRVDKHNNLIERTYHLEEQTALQSEKIKVINHRINDLEEYNK